MIRIRTSRIIQRRRRRRRRCFFRRPRNFAQFHVRPLPYRVAPSQRARRLPKTPPSSAAVAARSLFKPTELRVFSVNADRNALNMCDFGLFIKVFEFDELVYMRWMMMSDETHEYEYQRLSKKRREERRAHTHTKKKKKKKGLIMIIVLCKDSRGVCVWVSKKRSPYSFYLVSLTTQKLTRR